MKKWNTPEVTELNINETANGCLPFWAESCITDNVLDNNNNNNNNNGSGDDKGSGDTEQNS